MGTGARTIRRSAARTIRRSAALVAARHLAVRRTATLLFAARPPCCSPRGASARVSSRLPQVNEIVEECLESWIDTLSIAVLREMPVSLENYGGLIEIAGRDQRRWLLQPCA